MLLIAYPESIIVIQVASTHSMCCSFSHNETLELELVEKTILFSLSILFICLGQSDKHFESGSVQKMVFEEKRIEGKIRRPQLVLIQADQRPEFEPMILQKMGKSADITASVDKDIIEDIPNSFFFRFEGTRISNMKP